MPINLCFRKSRDRGRWFIEMEFRMKRSAIVFVVFLLGLLSLCVFTFKSCTSGSAAGGIGIFSEGERVGYVYKLSQKGTATKSWEGEMVLGPPGLTVFQDEDDKGRYPKC